MKRGFTLIEVLVVLGILSILSVLFVEIFFRSLKGNNKAQLLGIVKQNGQVALETMDKIIRNSDKVICPPPNTPSDTLVTQKDKSYIRFRFNSPTPSANGFISQDSGSDCVSALSGYISITNTDINNGVSVILGTFSRDTQPTEADLVAIDFSVGPAINIPKTLTDTLKPINFTTSVQLR